MSVLPSQQMTNNNLLTFCRPWLPMSHIILHPGVARSPAGQRVVFIAKGLEGAQQQCDANLMFFCWPWLTLSHVVLHPGAAEPSASPQAQFSVLK